MTATSGRKCIGSWTSSGPLGCLERTLLASSAWASTECFLTWKAAATPQGRLLFRLVPKMPRTGESVCSFWPTANAADGWKPEETIEHWDVRREQKAAVGINLQLTLEIAAKKTVAMWATPHAPRPRDNDETAGKYYPNKTGDTNALSQHGLAAQATGTTPSGSKAGTGSGGGSQGSLNPRFVEYLQGFPDNWTEV